MDGSSTLKIFLAEIYQRNGKLTPELVKESARSEDSPAHAWVFNVPESEAAESYYLQRAHELIRYVRIDSGQTDEGKVRMIRLYHAIPGDENSYVYESIDVIRASPSKFEAARTEALRRLKDAERSVEDLDMIGGTAATKRAVQSVKRARSLVQS